MGKLLSNIQETLKKVIEALINNYDKVLGSYEEVKHISMLKPRHVYVCFENNSSFG